MYSLEFKASVKKDFKKISKTDALFIKKSLLAFVEKFSTAYERELIKTGKIKKLQGQKETLFRLKLRRYRVIYKKEEDKLIILVLSVSTREGAYRHYTNWKLKIDNGKLKKIDLMNFIEKF